MRYSSIHVRRAEAADAPALAALADHARENPNGRPAAGTSAERFLAAINDSSRRVVLAEDSAGEVLGLAVFMRDSTGDLLDVPVLRVGALLVAPEHRRRGAGRALLAAAAACADEFGVEHVLASASSPAREVHRYLARLGFAPLTVRRIASLPVLRRNLGLADAGSDALPQDRLRRRVLGTVMRAPRAVAHRPSRRAGV